MRIKEELKPYKKANLHFILDSGTTRHMVHEYGFFDTWTPYDKPSKVLTSTGTILPATGEGSILIYPENCDWPSAIRLTGVLYVPGLQHNLLSINQIVKKGYSVQINNQGFSIKDTHFNLVGQRINGLYMLYADTRERTRTESTKLTYQEEEDSDLDVIQVEPKTIEDVARLPKNQQDIWIRAMNKETHNFDNEKTWQPETPPHNTKPVSTRWTYKVKRNEFGKVIKVRARLVARGFEQKYGEQFDECYAPVIKPTTLRTLLTLAADTNMEVNHIDFDSAFLYGKLKEPIYVYPPKHMGLLNTHTETYKLNAAIYGLKQASHAWYERLKHSLKEVGYSPTEADECLFTNPSGGHSYIVVHVDDLLIISKDKSKYTKVITQLKKEYSIKELGHVTCYLGTHIKKVTNPPHYQLHQSDKIINLIQDMSLQNIPQEKTPMLADYLHEKRQDSSSNMLDIKRYQQVLGSVMYLANTTRPDVALAAGVLGRSAHSPSELDWKALTRVVLYLKGTTHFRLPLGRLSQEQLLVYSDADWGGDPHTRRSTSGTCHLLYGSPVTWSSRRQKCVSLSTAEAEYVAAVEAAKDTQWMIKLFSELEFDLRLPINFQCDNQSAISIASSLKNGPRTKHINMKLHYLKEMMDQGIISMTYCASRKMVADIFTKPVPAPSFHTHTERLMFTNTGNLSQKQQMINE